MRRRLAVESGLCRARIRRAADQPHILRRRHVDASLAETAQDRELDVALDASTVRQVGYDAEDVKRHRSGAELTQLYCRRRLLQHVRLLSPTFLEDRHRLLGVASVGDGNLDVDPP